MKLLAELGVAVAFGEQLGKRADGYEGVAHFMRHAGGQQAET